MPPSQEQNKEALTTESTATATITQEAPTGTSGPSAGIQGAGQNKANASNGVASLTLEEKAKKAAAITTVPTSASARLTYCKKLFQEVSELKLPLRGGTQH
jgi:hypothetical protein